MSTVSPDSEARRAWLKATSLLSVLFVGLRQLYAVLADWIHGLVPATDAARVAPWLKRWVSEHDGNETIVMTIGVTLFLLLGFAIVRWLPKIPWIPWWPVQLVIVLACASLLRHVETSNWTPPATTENNLIAVASGLGVALVGGLLCLLTRRVIWLGRIMVAIGLVAAGAWVLLQARAAWTFDYGFFVGPANKLAQGEPLGSFYLQYNLLQTYLFRLMMAFDLRFHTMQGVLGLVVAVWLALFYWLAARLIENRFICFLFMVVLLLVRVVAVDGGPTLYPQVGPLRMELWVPLALVLSRFGINSPVTALAFALGYVADNTFGFICFAFYGAVLSATLLSEWRAGKRPELKHLARLGVPLLLAVVFQLWVFKGLTNPAAKIYQDVHVGFLPIALQSMFWLIVWMIFLAYAPVSLDPDEKRRSTSFFLFAFAAAMLVYFYGRSHDHNLLNLAGIWVFIAFVALDRLAIAGFPKALGPALAVAVMCFSLVGVWRAAEGKWHQVKSRVTRGIFLEPHYLDAEFDAHAKVLEPYAGQKVFLFSPDDAYYNYRFGVPQVGFFSPFFASVYADDTAQFLIDRLNEGFKVLMVRCEPKDLLDLNSAPLMTKNKQRFVMTPSGPAPSWTVIEITVAPQE